jgi:hypothetical protein
MDIAYQNSFRNLEILVPCCGEKSSLNDLVYILPAGFARFSIEIRNPSQDFGNRLPVLEELLNISLKSIWAHY